jgi:hypothetical protein
MPRDARVRPWPARRGRRFPTRSRRRLHHLKAQHAAPTGASQHVREMATEGAPVGAGPPLPASSAVVGACRSTAHCPPAACRQRTVISRLWKSAPAYGRNVKVERAAAGKPMRADGQCRAGGGPRRCPVRRLLAQAQLKQQRRLLCTRSSPSHHHRRTTSPPPTPHTPSMSKSFVPADAAVFDPKNMLFQRVRGCCECAHRCSAG